MVIVDKKQNQLFDVFLSYKHNPPDTPIVKKLVGFLKHYGLTVWFDEEAIRPGVSWQSSMETGIKRSKSGAVLFGRANVGPWQDEEMQALLRLAARCQLPLIPVLLPETSKRPDNLPIFLSNRRCVDLSAGFTQEGLSQLVWGITGRRRVLTPLPNANSPTNITEYIAKRGHLIHKLKAKDSTGRWAYYFVLVESELESAFLQALESNKNIDLEDYGKVVASSYGERPSEDVKTFLKVKYGFDV